ncbi:hypothetical protein DFH27DRAFT_624604 [Peziza echinospora]|nr:hypothetical protein DFH27DRAFT_624604 [Peziza echinospora]
MAVPEAKNSKPMEGLTIAAAGNFGKTYSHEFIGKSVTKHGGQWSDVVDEKVTHLVTKKTEVERNAPKVQQAMDIKSKKPIYIVGLDWLITTISKLLRGNEEEFSVVEVSKLEKAMANARKLLKELSPEVNVDEKDEIPIVMIKGDLRPDPGSRVAKTHKIVGFVNFISVDIKTPAIQFRTYQILQSTGKAQNFGVWVISGTINAGVMQKDICTQTFLRGASKKDTYEEAVAEIKTSLKRPSVQGFTRVEQDLNANLPSPPVDDGDQQCLATLFKLILPTYCTPDSSPAVSAEAAAKNPVHNTFGSSVSLKSLENGKLLLGTLQELVNLMELEPDVTSNGDSLPTEPETIPETIPGGDITAKHDELIESLLLSYYRFVPFSDMSKGICNTVARIEEETNALSARILSLAAANPIPKERPNPWKKQLQHLNLSEAVPVSKSTKEYQYLSEYFEETLMSYQTSQYNLWPMTLRVKNIKNIEIIRIERTGEIKNTENWTKKFIRNDNRRLLWHGTPAVNAARILQGGLQDPRNLGGIYFSETATTSLGYACRGAAVVTTPLVYFLCEVQLGSRTTNYNKNGAMNFVWQDAGIVRDDFKGVLMPDVNKYMPPYQHTEWIAKNPSQIRHRYIFLLHI